jgi:hypothetical protein
MKHDAHKHMQEKFNFEVVWYKDQMFWKCGTVQIFGNDYNKSKPDSGGN